MYGMQNPGRKDCKLHWYPKFYNHVILFVGSKPSGTLVDFFQTHSGQTLCLKILIYKGGNVVYHRGIKKNSSIFYYKKIRNMYSIEFLKSKVFFNAVRLNQ